MKPAKALALPVGGAASTMARPAVAYPLARRLSGSPQWRRISARARSRRLAAAANASGAPAGGEGAEVERPQRGHARKGALGKEGERAAARCRLRHAVRVPGALLRGEALDELGAEALQLDAHSNWAKEQNTT